MVSTAGDRRNDFDLGAGLQGVRGIAGTGHELQVHGHGKRGLGCQVGHGVGDGGAIGQLHGVLVDEYVHVCSAASRSSCSERSNSGASSDCPVFSTCMTTSSMAGAIMKPWRYKPLTSSTRSCTTRTAGRLSGRV